VSESSKPKYLSYPRRRKNLPGSGYRRNISNWDIILKIYEAARKFGDCFAGFVVERIVDGKERDQDMGNFKFHMLKRDYFRMLHGDKETTETVSSLKYAAAPSMVNEFETAIIGESSTFVANSVEADFQEMAHAAKKQYQRMLYRKYKDTENYSGWKKYAK